METQKWLEYEQEVEKIATRSENVYNVMPQREQTPESQEVNQEDYTSQETRWSNRSRSRAEEMPTQNRNTPESRNGQSYNTANVEDRERNSQNRSITN